jgi:hypothetical protein
MVEVDVSGWHTPAAYFPWRHLQTYVDAIDVQVYQAARELAQEQYLPAARPCPGCEADAASLFWFSVTDPEPAWDAGTGRVGFIAVCVPCRLQVDFFIDPELTQMQAEQWRACRMLA